ncbi:MAG TPA: Wzz/FepE/Etk N-terminal domain-containing protein [Steroidobacter sp.]|uniref:Wzz/FepE/Etk N-terminal domain-containing protein n=1 Tax=Steroidobacter sp. TaxID=1978227 RepID=UPI002ED90E5B
MLRSTESLLIQRDSEVDVLAMIGVAWRYKFVIAGIAFACALLAAVIALKTTPVFRAEVVVTESRSDTMSASSSLTSQLGGLASLAGINLQRNAAGQDSQAVLRSRHLAEEFIKRNDLTAELAPGSGKTSTLWYAVNALRDTVLEINQDDKKGTTTISINWPDATVAARWANQYVALANELIRARALNDSSRNIKYLNEQIAKTNVVEIQNVMYRLIETETKTQMLANAREEYAFTVVDPAVPPERRIWPRRTLMVATGGVLGAILGFVVALFHNMWRRHRQEVAISS